MSSSHSPSTPSNGSHYQPSLPIVVLLLVLFVGTTFLVLRGSSASSSASTTPTSTTTNHSGSTSTTSTTVVQHHVPESQVSVQVTNGTNIHELARTYTEKLQTLGWDTLSPINGPHVTATIVFWKAGYEWAASDIATALNVPQSAVRALGASQPVAGAQGDDIVVVLGPNVAH